MHLDNSLLSWKEVEISVAEIRRKNDFACLRAAEIELEVHRCNLRIVRNLETELSVL